MGPVTEAANKDGAEALGYTENQHDATERHFECEENEVELDRTLSILRKRHEVLTLQKAIADFERGEQHNTVQTISVAPANRLSFRDIEQSICKFDGEDRAYSVHDFKKF